MAWDATKPTDSGLLINAPGQIRSNWDALALGSDASLLITNGKVASNANITESKILFSGSGHGHTGGTDGINIDLTTAITGTLPLANGGTNITSYTHGDILYVNGSAVLSKLGQDTAGKVLRTEGAGANPTWGYPADITIASQAQGDILYHDGTNWVRLAKGTAKQVLQMNTGLTAPEWVTNSGDIWVNDDPTIAFAGTMVYGTSAIGDHSLYHKQATASSGVDTTTPTTSLYLSTAMTVCNLTSSGDYVEWTDIHPVATAVDIFNDGWDNTAEVNSVEIVFQKTATNTHGVLCSLWKKAATAAHTMTIVFDDTNIGVYWASETVDNFAHGLGTLGNDGAFHHIVVNTSAATSSGEVFLDGASLGTLGVASGTAQPDSIVIGDSSTASANQGSKTSNATGYMDSVIVRNRHLLAEEITSRHDKFIADNTGAGTTL